MRDKGEITRAVCFGRGHCPARTPLCAGRREREREKYIMFMLDRSIVRARASSALDGPEIRGP